MFVQQAHPSSFGITSSLAPTADKARSVSPSKRTDETQSQTSAASFASSGFAALSSSSASPFGALGSSSMAPAASSPFLRSTPISPNNTDSSEALDSTKAEPSANGGFGGFAKTSPRGFGATQPSPFAASGAANSSGFGGSVFGGAFGGGGGGKLTNFAAPIGDTKLGTTNGAIKPIGSPTREGDDDDDENSDEEAEALGENKNEGSDEVDDRFQHKDGKLLVSIDGHELIGRSRNWRRRRDYHFFFAGKSIHLQG